MYVWEIKDDLQKDLDKLEKKNKALFEQIGKKILQIAENPDLGKPLGNVLCGKKRSHVGGSFVLIFKVDESRKLITFLSLEHHDNAYR
jgi:mRNA interferase RelE/StbE